MAAIVNEPFADFTLPNQDGESVSLKDLAGKWLVLFVYPKDDTPGCTVESQAFSAGLPLFAERNTVVYGLSADDVASHKAFCNKFELQVPLLADTDAHLLSALEVGQTEWEGNMYWNRTTFLVDDKGVLRKVYENVKPKGHDAEVLKDIVEMQNS